MDTSKAEIKAMIRECLTADRGQSPSGVFGVVTSYSRYTNTATVVVTKADTDEIDEVLNNVPCPVLLGIQSVAPTPGMPCYILYKGGNSSQAVISHFYNHRYNDYNYGPQNETPTAIPTYLLG